jgi:3-oxoacyl-[acyl-carrier protein] reductase
MPSLSLSDGCALVTGGSRGIGAAGGQRVVSEIEAAGGRAMALQGDVADPDAPDALFGALESAYDRPVLVLVNNAGITDDNITPALSDEAWQTVIDTDLTSAFRFTRRALRSMMRARTGRIVNIASVVGLRANPGQPNYAAAKAGLIALTRNAAVEVARRGITINAVAPGWIDTEMMEAVDRSLLERVPARRAGTPEEVAACVRFLTSEEAGYVTGAVLSVDGGLAA